MQFSGWFWVTAVGLVSMLGGCASEANEGESEANENEAISDGEQGASQDALSNAKTDTGHASVGQLITKETWVAACLAPNQAQMCNWSSTTTCTATLIGSKSAVTAAHCIPGPVKAGVKRTSELKFSTKTVTVGGLFKFSAYMDKPGDRFWNDDFGMLRLATAPGIAPSLLANRGPVVGEAITLVGWGTTDQTNGAGTKRIATNKIDGFDAAPGTTFNFGGTKAGVEGNVCKGDSGGPVFVKINGVEAQLGVVTASLTSCTSADATRGWAGQIVKAKGFITNAKTPGDVITLIDAKGVKTTL
jgi:hypothetical protein